MYYVIPNSHRARTIIVCNKTFAIVRAQTRCSGSTFNAQHCLHLATPTSPHHDANRRPPTQPLYPTYTSNPHRDSPRHFQNLPSRTAGAIHPLFPPLTCLLALESHPAQFSKSFLSSVLVHPAGQFADTAGSLARARSSRGPTRALNRHSRWGIP